MSETQQKRRRRFRSFRWFDDYKRPPSEYEEVTVYYSTWGIQYMEDQKTSPIVSPVPFHMNPDYTPIHGFMKPETHTLWRHSNWEAFRDPHKVYYKTYNEMQWEAEESINEVLSTAKSIKLFQHLDSGYREFLGRVVPPQRYYVWSTVKALLYTGNRVPSSPINACVVFELADGLREVQRDITWSEELGVSGDDAKRAWMADAAWQPLREYGERLMTLKDWGEIVFATNAIISPLLHGLANVETARVATEHGDLATAHMLRKLDEDYARRYDWTVALLEFMHGDPMHGQSNLETNQEWTARWAPLASRAVEALLPLYEGMADIPAVRTDLWKSWRELLTSQGLNVPEEVSA